MKILKISFEKQDFPKVWMKCLEIARLQDIAPNTQYPLLRGARLAMLVDDPPLEIPAYGPAKIYRDPRLVGTYGIPIQVIF